MPGMRRSMAICILPLDADFSRERDFRSRLKNALARPSLPFMANRPMRVSLTMSPEHMQQIMASQCSRRARSGSMTALM